MSVTWSISAEATLQEARESAGCPALLRRALGGALAWQDRNRREVSQTLLLGSIAPQWTAAMLALGATVTIEGETAPEEVPLQAVMERTVGGKPITLHVNAQNVAWGEAHVARTPADAPIVSAVAGVWKEGGTVRQARLVLTGVWAKPVGMAESIGRLRGRTLDEQAIEDVAQSVEAEVKPRGDFLGSVEYRTAMAGVLTRRALVQCQQEVSHE